MPPITLGSDFSGLECLSWAVANLGLTLIAPWSLHSHLQLVQVCFNRISWSKSQCPILTKDVGPKDLWSCCHWHWKLQHHNLDWKSWGNVVWTLTWSSSVKPTVVFESWWKVSTIQRLSTKSLEQVLFGNMSSWDLIWQGMFSNGVDRYVISIGTLLWRPNVPRVQLNGFC